VTPESVPTIRLDLHNHTRGSWDCLTDPEALLERSLARGIHRIAITDHNRLALAWDLYRKYPDRVIPGEEVKTHEGFDLIGLYIRNEIPKGTPTEEVCRSIRADGGVIYLPHPFAPGKGKGGRLAEEVAPSVDVIEVFNARLHPGRLNAAAEGLARRHGKLMGAGSDAHTLMEAGGAWVEVPPHQNRPDALLKALAEAQIRGRTAPLWIHLGSTWAKLRKRMPLGVRTS
jgi:predicted metal-dependent phosphoesterase TrpH